MDLRASRTGTSDVTADGELSFKPISVSSKQFDHLPSVFKKKQRTHDIFHIVPALLRTQGSISTGLMEAKTVHADFSELQGGPNSQLLTIFVCRCKNPPQLIHIRSIPGFPFCFPVPKHFIPALTLLLHLPASVSSL